VSIFMDRVCRVGRGLGQAGGARCREVDLLVRGATTTHPPQTKACKTFLHHLEECGERLAEGKTIVQNETCVEAVSVGYRCQFSWIVCVGWAGVWVKRAVQDAER
jgi:hypothetical protein